MPYPTALYPVSWKQRVIAAPLLLLCVAVVAEQRDCDVAWSQYFIHISAGAECSSEPCDENCQRNIDRVITACTTMKVPQTVTMFDENHAGRTALRNAGPKSCNYEMGADGTSRRLLEAQGNFEEAETQESPGPGASTTTPEAAKSTNLMDSHHPDDLPLEEQEALEAQEYNQRKSKQEVWDAHCKDTAEGCADWAADGECTNNAEYMSVACAKSCNACGRLPELQECVNLHAPDDCDAWAADGECTHNKGFMALNCRRSCNLCNERPEA